MTEQEYVQQGIEFLESNPQKAFISFQKAANMGSASGMMHLGMMYYDGQGTIQDDDLAFFYIEKAASMGYTPAYCPLAQCYMYDNGIETDYDKALYYINLSIENNVNLEWANQMLSEFEFEEEPVEEQIELDQDALLILKAASSDPVTAVSIYKDLASRGNMNGMYNLASCLQQGKGIFQNEEEAIYWYTQASNMGDMSSKLALVRIYLNSTRFYKDYELAKKLLNQLIESNTYLDQVKDLKEIFDYNKPSEEYLHVNEILSTDPVRAKNIVLQEANKSNPEATFNMGVFNEFGIGLDININGAITWYKEAIQLGFNKGYIALAKLYLKQKDPEAARNYAKKAIEAGESVDEADEIIEQSKTMKPKYKGNDYSRWIKPGINVEEVYDTFQEGFKAYNTKDYTIAVECFEKTGRVGHPFALYMLGKCYIYGNGVLKDIDKGIKFLEAASYRQDYMARKILVEDFGWGYYVAPWKRGAYNTGNQKFGNLINQLVMNYQKQHGMNHTVRSAMEYAAKNKDALDYSRRMYNPAKGRSINGNAEIGVVEYFREAMAMGNLDALCGFADTVGHFKEIDTYKRGAMNGSSYAMYRVGEYYMNKNTQIAYSCFAQAAKWGYQKAIDTCKVHGINY